MIAANVAAATYLLGKKIPAPYRVHDRPPESKFEDLQEFLTEFGLRLPPYNEVTPLDYAALLKRVRNRPDASLLESVLLRSMSLAVYQPGNIGHFGLALDAYAHFTSPIRRYADLLVHRAIGHALTGGKASDYDYAAHDIAALATHCSENSRRAEEAERDVDERYKCAWMEQHVGSTFQGTISGVTSFGLFVELDESGVNGLVHVTQLPNDYYHFDPVRKLMTGERRRKQFRLGDRVSVLVLRASLEERKIDFRLVEDESAHAGHHAADKPGQAPGSGKASASKTTAKKAVAKNAAARKAAGKKAAVRKAAAEKAAVKKAAAKKATGKKAANGKTAVKKAATRKAATKKAPARQ